MRSGRLDLTSRLVRSVIAAAIVITACAPAGGPRVGIKPLSADLVFGIPPVDEPVAPPDTIVKPPRAIALPDRDFDFDENDVSGDDCPTPAINDIQQEARSEIGDMPREGNYLWKIGGSYKVEGIGTLPIAATRYARLIFDLKPLQTSRDYTYKTLQPDLSGNLVALTWEVIQSRPKATQVGGPPPAGGNIVRDNENLNGVYLTRITSYTSESPSGSHFIMNPPMLFLPLPAFGGFTRSSTSTDPSSFNSLQMTINVRSTEPRFEACGEMVNGWYVESEQTFTFAEGSDRTPTSVKRKYNYSVATQFGGIIVFEHVELPCNATNAETGACEPEADVIYNTNIGTTDPAEFKGAEELTPPKS